jgi:hypothetical protein
MLVYLPLGNLHNTVQMTVAHLSLASFTPANSTYSVCACIHNPVEVGRKEVKPFSLARCPTYTGFWMQTLTLPYPLTPCPRAGVAKASLYSDSLPSWLFWRPQKKSWNLRTNCMTNLFADSWMSAGFNSFAFIFVVHTICFCPHVSRLPHYNLFVKCPHWQELVDVVVYLIVR